MESDECKASCSSNSESEPPDTLPKSNVEGRIASSSNLNAQSPAHYFKNVYLAAETTVRYKFAKWIRLFVYYGGVLLSQDDQRLATHVLHTCDEESFEDVERYYEIRHAIHVNIEWIKDTIKKGCLQDDRAYRVTLLPGKALR